MRKNQVLSTIATLAVLMLCACEASTPSLLHSGQIRVTEDMATRTFDSKQVDEATVSTVSRQYLHNGLSDMVLTISYPQSGDLGLNAASAREQAEKYKRAFERYGVSGINIETVPVSDPRYAHKAVVSYKSVVARAPEGCTDLPVTRGATDIDTVDAYGFGCSVKTVVSKMVADPTDLMGKSDTQDGDSRRGGATAEGYASGKPNERMKGFSASSLGSGG